MLRLTILLFCFLTSTAHAQITLDGSMGTTGSLAGPNFTIPAAVGQTRGSNLFHSFGLFNVLTGQSATFTGPNSVSNIFGRVTGGQPSNINGTIRSTIPSANLYLMNPAGMMFGPNASLDVQGSFHVTTADYLKFADGAKFHADLARQSTLTTAPVSAFGFLTANSTPISVQHSGLAVVPGQTFSIVGGNIELVGDPTLGFLSAPGGRINIASVASSGEINLRDPDLGVDSFAQLGSIATSQNFLIDVIGGNSNVDPAGTVVIRGGQIFSRDSLINARGNPGGIISIAANSLDLGNSLIIAATQGSTSHSGTAVEIHVRGPFRMTDGEIAASSILGGKAGNIRITADSLELGPSDPNNTSVRGFRGDIGSRAFGSGRGGDVEITAKSITVKNGFFINTATINSGDAGDVTVRADTLTLLDGGFISSNAFGSGRGGVVDIIVKDAVFSATNQNKIINCNCTTGIQSQTGFGSNGGVLRLTADTLRVADGAQISAALFSSGQGTSIEVTAKSLLIAGVMIDNASSPPDIHSGIDARLFGPFATGTGGNIRVTADDLRMTDGALITTGLFRGAPGKAGNINVFTESLEIDKRAAMFASSIFGTGSAGNIDITAKQVRVTGLSESADPFGQDFTGLSTATNAGRGGSLRVFADEVSLNSQSSLTSLSLGSGAAGNIEINSGILSVGDKASINAVGHGAGKGGDITIMAGTVQLQTGAAIGATNLGTGDAGNVRINATDSFVSRNAIVTTQALRGDGGDIEIRVGSLLHLDRSHVTTAVGTGNGAGGNIIIDPQFVVLNRSQISANAFGGPGGNIAIVADNFLASPDSTITASSALSTPGTIDIQAPIVDLSGSIAPLPEAIVQATSLLRQSCATRYSSGKLSSLAPAGRSGMPLEPGGFLASSLSNLTDPSISQNNTAAIQTMIASVPPKFSIASPCAALY